ncbi:leucyl aminopeptidase family protein [Myxococcota bacterium]|nr:leucyl aminopeptidase family protein [Myxococcota bacterium]
MVRIVFAKDPATALKGSKAVLVVAAQSVYDASRFPKIFGAKLRRLILDLASDVKPGDHGNVGSTLTGAEPRRLFAGVLPDKVSRYNAEARPEGIYKIVSGAGLARETRPAIILVLDDEAHQVAALNAVGRAFPLFTAKTDDKDKREQKIHVSVVDRSGRPIEVGDLAKETMIAAREVAALVDTPPTDMNPEALAAAAKRLVGEHPSVTFEEIVGDDLVANGLGGIHAVGRTAKKAPRMLVARYRPKKAEGHVALVGKGVTFDTGGLHLKARGMMETMKSDMGGAAAVAGAFRVLVNLGVELEVSLVMCLAENAIGPDSFKPDDILTLHSGKTVEINNTDAEGRLLLGDGVSWAARVLGAQWILDAATLTGAQLIATGQMHAAIISNDADLEELVLGSAYDTGDLVHPLPFAPELYKAEFKSPVADMRNSVKDRNNAQTSCAAQFIYNHLDDTKVKWCHVDLAGPAFRGDRGTGFGVALLSDAVLRIAATHGAAG